jgi:DNA-binding NtrC family response regulator
MTGPFFTNCLNILVVDDEPLIRWSLAQALSAHGHTVLEADTAAAARHLLATTGDRFDVVLLDYCLPDSRDLNLLTDVRRASPASAVVMMTAGGYATEAMIDAALALGASRALTKPVDMETIEQVLSSACRTREWNPQIMITPIFVSPSAM